MKCTLCGNVTSSPEITGQTLVKKQLVTYVLCKTCYMTMPDNNTARNRPPKNARQDYWDLLRNKLKNNII